MARRRELRSPTVNVGLSRELHPQLSVGAVHNLTVSWRWGLAGHGPGVRSMMVVLLIAGLGLVLAGLLTVGFGVLLELSFGNTLILAGAIAACTGMILLGFWTVVRELKNIARRLGAGVAVESHASLPSAAASADPSREGGGFLFSRDQPAAGNTGNAEPATQSASPLPWHEEAASRDRVRGDVPSVPESVEAA